MKHETIVHVNEQIEGLEDRVNDLSYDMEMFYQECDDIIITDEDNESNEMVTLYTLTEELRRVIGLLDQFERNLEELKL